MQDESYRNSERDRQDAEKLAAFEAASATDDNGLTPKGEIHVFPEETRFGLTWYYAIGETLSAANYHNSASAWAAARRPQQITPAGYAQPVPPRKCQCRAA